VRWLTNSMRRCSRSAGLTEGSGVATMGVGGTSATGSGVVSAGWMTEEFAGVSSGFARGDSEERDDASRQAAGEGGDASRQAAGER
jgi:hypothetical protein